MMTIGSLFSGIGGLELGLERAGIRTVWQVEKDDYCRRVLAKHWPDAQRFDDVCTVGAHNLSPVDVICGGFPCQDISAAGKGAGIAEGTRSGLWYEFRRIVRELRPNYVLVENVSALLARGLDIVLGDLAACGYDAEWDCIPAAAVGAPHRRDRIFIVAYPNSVHGGEGTIMADTDCAGLQRSEHKVTGEGAPAIPGQPSDCCGTHNVADATRDLLAEQAQGGTERQRAGSCGEPSRGECDWWLVEPNVGRVAHGVPDRVDRLRALGNAVVPQVAEYIGRLIVAAERERAA